MIKYNTIQKTNYINSYNEKNKFNLSEKWEFPKLRVFVNMSPIDENANINKVNIMQCVDCGIMFHSCNDACAQ